MSKILIIAMNLNSGGAERQTVAIAKALKSQGHQVTVACFYHGDFYLPELQKSNIQVLWKVEKSYVRRILSFRKLIRSGGYHAVISLLVTPNIINLLSAIGGKTWKVIIGERSAKAEFFKSTKAKVIKMLLGYADALVCNSNNAVEIWKGYAPKYSSIIKCIYNLLPEYIPSKPYCPKQNGKLSIVVAASYQPLKNMKRLILAVSKLPEGDRLKLSLDWYGQINVAGYGSQPYDESLDLIKKHNLGSVISLNPPTRDIYDIMNKADAVALVSEVEGLPNVICEALMLGKPIIMSNVSDYNVLVGNGNGYVCEYDSVDSIAHAIKSLLHLNTEELLQMGVNSRKLYTNLLCSDVIVNSWNKLILT